MQEVTSQLNQAANEQVEEVAAKVSTIVTKAFKAVQDVWVNLGLSEDGRDARIEAFIEQFKEMAESIRTKELGIEESTKKLNQKLGYKIDDLYLELGMDNSVNYADIQDEDPLLGIKAKLEKELRRLTEIKNLRHSHQSNMEGSRSNGNVCKRDIIRNLAKQLMLGPRASAMLENEMRMDENLPDPMGALDARAARMGHDLESKAALLKSVKRFQELSAKLREFHVRNKDPNRFVNRRASLLALEKDKLYLDKVMPDLFSKLQRDVKQWERENVKEFFVGDERFLDTMESYIYPKSMLLEPNTSGMLSGPEAAASVAATSRKRRPEDDEEPGTSKQPRWRF